MPRTPKYETPASLRGIISQLQRNIDAAFTAYDVTLTVKQAKRIEKTLKQYLRQEEILTGEDRE